MERIRRVIGTKNDADEDETDDGVKLLRLIQL